MIDDVVVGGYWLVEEKIGEGSFGEVFRAKHITTKQLYAIKREATSIEDPQLPHEYKTLKLLDGYDHIPKVHWFGEKSAWNCIVMDLLGPSLRSLNQAFRSLPVAFISDIAIQMVSILEYIHNKGIVYRDIKPDNFLLEKCFPISSDRILMYNTFDETPESKLRDFQLLIGRKHKVFLVDFGLSTNYVDQKTGFHIQKNQKMLKSKTGTARYAALNVHRGYYHTRRDDMESLGYVFLELLRGSLPWSGVIARNSRQGWAKMQRMKEELSLVELFEGLPTGFMTYLNYCRKLDFDQKPDYDYLKKVLSETTGSGSEAELVVPEVKWFDDVSFNNAPLSPFNRAKKFSSRQRMNKDFTTKEHCDHHGNRNDKKSVYIKRPVAKGAWFISKNPGAVWDQEVAAIENAWKEGCSWNGNNVNYKSKSVRSTPTNEHSFNDNLDNFNHHNKAYSLPCQETGKKNDYHQAKNKKSIGKTWNMKYYNDQKWDNVENTWKQGRAWTQDNVDSQELSSIPSTPINEGGINFWSYNMEQEFHGFDGGLQSSDVRQRNQQRNSDESKHRPDPINLERSHSLTSKKSRDLHDLQSRRPSIPSPLSISIPPKSISNPANSAVLSPNFTSGSDYGNKNISLGPRRSIPNIRNNNNSLATKFLKRSVPNLRDVANNNVVPPLSATIKRTMAHMQDAQQVPAINTRKQQVINSRCLPREFIQQNSNEDTHYASHNVKYSIQDARYSPQDARFSLDVNHRKRSNTYSHNYFKKA
nr:4261_t:CDS:10 [Entrophospora candida]CAG8595363.1 4012_t:CDS:10 [Entrophospora candida]